MAGLGVGPVSAIDYGLRGHRLLDEPCGLFESLPHGFQREPLVMNNEMPNRERGWAFFLSLLNKRKMLLEAVRSNCVTSQPNPLISIFRR